MSRGVWGCPQPHLSSITFPGIVTVTRTTVATPVSSLLTLTPPSLERARPVQLGGHFCSSCPTRNLCGVTSLGLWRKVNTAELCVSL